MLKQMTANDRAYHAGASENALITEDEDHPVVVVVDNGRVEVYWTDDELDTHNFYNVNPLAREIGEMIDLTVKRWADEDFHPAFIQSKLDIMLPDLGFTKI